jgi:hypothetical protein
MLRRTLRLPAPGLALLAAFTLLIGSFAGSAPVFAKKKDAPPPAAGEKKDEKKDDDSPFKDWDKVLKDVETQKGFLTVHKKYDNVWFEIAPAQIDKPFLVVSSLTSGLGKGMLLGGMPLDTDLWVFHRAGNRLQIRVKNTRFRADEGSDMAKAVELSYADSVLASAKIVSINKETNNLLIEANDVLLSDIPGVGLALKQFLGGPASLDKDRTAISRVKVFPKNV